MPRELAEHSLHVRPDAKPVKQPLRRFAEDRRKVIGDEIARLLAAGFIMEVLHPDWLSNPVLVEKKKDDPMLCHGVAHVYRLHKPEQGVSKGSLSFASDRSSDRLHRWV